MPFACTIGLFLQLQLCDATNSAATSSLQHHSYIIVTAPKLHLHQYQYYARAVVAIQYHCGSYNTTRVLRLYLQQYFDTTMTPHPFHCRELDIARVCLYNYGSPRVGNSVFQKTLEDRVDEVWRVRNVLDVVCTIPLAVPINPYSHAQPGLLLDMEDKRVLDAG